MIFVLFHVLRTRIRVNSSETAGEKANLAISPLASCQVVQLRCMISLEMKSLGICPFSAEKLLLHCFENADQTGVEEIPHPQINQQDFNSLIAKFTVPFQKCAQEIDRNDSSISHFPQIGHEPTSVSNDSLLLSLHS
jgi:hypothetical protein